MMAERVNAWSYDLILPVGLWCSENPISNFTNSKKWEFKNVSCYNHVEDKGMANLDKYDETVAYNPQVQYIQHI